MTIAKVSILPGELNINKMPFNLSPTDKFRTGKMSQCIRPGSIPSTHTAVYNFYNSNSKKSNALFWPQLAVGTHVVHIHAHGQTLIITK